MSFLPRDAMYTCKRGYCRHAVSVIIAGYRRLLDVRSAKNIYRRRSWVYDTVGHAPQQSIDCWTCELRSDKNSYRRPCSVDSTVGDAPANVCDGLQHGWIGYGEEKRIENNLIVCSGISEAETTNNRLRSTFCIDLYRHEASRGLFATAELLV